MPRATVVIPNWNGLAHLPECMRALENQTYRDFKTVVVDNGSTDESVAWLRANSPETRIVERASNGGFAAAVNDGIRVAAPGCEYVALLNNDTAADSRWLEELVNALDSSDYDFAALLMVLYEEPETIDAAGDDFSIVDMAGRNRGRLENAALYSEPVRVLGACAGAALFRARLFAEVGLFDEEFFLMHEDTDFNLRCLVAGKRCVYVPTAVVRHKHSATISAQPAWPMLRYRVRNRTFALAKDLPMRLLPLAAILGPWHLFRSTFPLRPSNWHMIPSLVASLPARIAAELEGLRMGWRKRPDVWRLQAIPTREIIRWFFDGTGPV